MRKLLFVIPTLGGGGAERSLVNLLNELPPERYEIELMLFKKCGVFLPQVPAHVKLLEQTPALKGVYAPVREAGRYLPRKLLGTLICRIAESDISARNAFRWEHFFGPAIERLPGSYDVAVGYLGGESMNYVLEKVTAKKKINWIHNDYQTSKMTKRYDLELFEKADEIVTVSESCLEILQKEFPDCAGKLRCIANITSSRVIRNRAEEFYPQEYRDTENILLSIGRLSEQKGFDLAIRAARILKERGAEFHWFIVGEGELREKLERQLREDGVEDRVSLLGLRENPYPYIKNCRLLVQPSRYEGKSVVLDEAKILAKPIVATAYPTVRDQIEDGKEGLIAEMTPEGIAEKIEELLDDRTLCERISGYLAGHEYGNQEELEKYIALFG